MCFLFNTLSHVLLNWLMQLFDLDKDGILDFRQYEKLLRCVGYRLGGSLTCSIPCYVVLAALSSAGYFLALISVPVLL